MEIIVQAKIKGVKKVKNISDITENSRLFYEIGYYVDEDNTNWVRGVIFKEIQNIKSFIKEDYRLLNKEFIEHHNFVVIDKEKVRYETT